MFFVPTGIRSFENIDNAGFVSDVSGVVKGEEVSVLIKSELLRVPESVMDHFEI